MDRREIGESGIHVTPICIGCWQFNDNFPNDKQWEPQSYEVSKAITDEALRLGINFFDTAEAYTNSQEVVGRLFEGRRQNVVLADKFGYRDGRTDYKAVDVEESLQLSLRKLRTDYVDLYQVHWANVIADMDGVINELKRQQALGRIRSYGICNFGAKNLNKMLEAGGKPISDQIAYNLLWRGSEYDLLPLCRSKGVSILAYSPLQQGLLCGKFSSAEEVPKGRKRTRHFKTGTTPLTQHGGEGAEKETFQTIERIREVATEVGLPMAKLSLSWLLQQPMVAATIVGASTPKQVEQNVEIAKLKQEVVDRLSLSSEELKKVFAGEMDMWASNRIC